MQTPMKLSVHKTWESLSVTQRQIVLYGLIGVVNTAFSYACYAVFIFCGLHYALAVALATCLGVLFNFMTTGKIVFKNFNNHLIIKFVGVYTFLYFINVWFIKLMQTLSTNYYLTGFVAIFPLAVISFILNKYFVFRERHETN